MTFYIITLIKININYIFLNDEIYSIKYENSVFFNYK